MLTHAERAEAYARAVVAGDVLACKYAKAAGQRHLDDLERVRARDETWPFYFDHEEANRVCLFIEQLPHIKGDQAKRELIDGVWTYPKIVLEDWQCFLVAVLFGWRTIEQRVRRFRRGYIEVGRKNAKSTLLAGIALEQLAGDGEEGPEVYTAATKKDQARILWEVAAEMVHRQPEFKQLGVGFNKSLIYCARNGGKFQPLARDYGSLDGLNTSCFISDEVHAQKDRKLYDVLDSSTGARSQPLGVSITTSGTDRSGVCYALRTYVVKLLNAVLHRHGGMGFQVKGGTAVDETFFGIIYTLDTDYADKRPNDDWADEAVWIKANPMLGATRSTDYARTLLGDLRAACQKARTMPSEQAEFRTKRCDEWMNADTAWMDMHAWNACGDPELNEYDFKGEDCCIGLDAAFKTDLFAKVKVFERDGHYYAFGRYYAPQRMLRLSGNEHLASWAAEGRIRETPGEVVDIEVVRDHLFADRKEHEVLEVPFDPAQLTQFAGEMLDEGFEMVELRPTTLNFSEAMKFLEELVLQGRFHHDGDPVLEWMVSNVVCHRDHRDNIYPNKEKPENKIDGVIGLIMAITRMMVQQRQGQSLEVVVV
jgi:phage terminase large subunit-like protein